jgi:signal transduction histidine kinase
MTSDRHTRQTVSQPPFIESSYMRLVIAVALITLGYFSLLFYFVNSYTERLYEVRKEELRRIVELGMAALDPLREESAGGQRSMEQTRREGAILIRDLTHRYRLGENYLFMGTDTGLMLVHPYEPGMEFTNQWDLTDTQGTHIIQEMVAVATSEEGAGYVEYYYPPPDSDQPERKVSYIVGIPEWHAFIGAGMYMDDIDAENWSYLVQSMLLTLILLMLVFVVVYAALRPTILSYRTLLTLFEQVQQHPNKMPGVPLENFRDGSEAWNLLDGFREMLEQIERSKRAREEAVLTERHRIARELHDAVSQTLFSATILADVLPRLWDRDENVGRERLLELRELTRGALAEMRTLLHELRPSALVQTSMEDLLRQLTEALIARGRVPIGLTIEGEFDLPPDVKIALYRIAQEALNNVIKHARANSASVSLYGDSHNLLLTILDDGRGFDPDDVMGEHLGLDIMQERAQAIRATLAVRSEPGAGTEVSVSWTQDTPRLPGGAPE